MRKYLIVTLIIVLAGISIYENIRVYNLWNS